MKWAHLLKKDAEKVMPIALSATTFELWMPFEVPGPPAADSAPETEKQPADGRHRSVDVVWQPSLVQQTSGSLSNQTRPAVDADCYGPGLVREEARCRDRATLPDPCRYCVAY